MANDDDKNTDAPIPLTAMTLRDHFAASALMGMLPSQRARDVCQRCGGAPHLTALAYSIADAMLAERAKGGGR